MVKTYEKGDVIMRISDGTDDTGILVSGAAHLVRIDIDGRKSIIDYYENGDVFGKRFSPDFDTDTYFVYAKKKCSVDYASDITYELMFNAVKKMQTHIDILSRRTIRAKLITYFEYLRTQKKADRFTLPLNISDLADYIAADRSAMTREMQKLNQEGIIESKGNTIFIKESLT